LKLETFCKYTNEVKVRYDFKNAEFLRDTISKTQNF